jgi:hypothetical protein
MPDPSMDGMAHALLRIYQVFVNVEGIHIRKRGIMRLVSKLTRQRHGFYAVMLVAASEDSKPPLLLSLVKDTLMEEFSLLSRTPPESWDIKLVDWRMVGMAPPMFQDFGCIDKEWGAAWYDMVDTKAKQHRYRLTKRRLWEGKRAKTNPVLQETQAADAEGVQPAIIEMKTTANESVT